MANTTKQTLSPPTHSGEISYRGSMFNHGPGVDAQGDLRRALSLYKALYSEEERAVIEAAIPKMVEIHNWYSPNNIRYAFVAMATWLVLSKHGTETLATYAAHRFQNVSEAGYMSFDSAADLAEDWSDLAERAADRWYQRDVKAEPQDEIPETGGC